MTTTSPSQSAFGSVRAGSLTSPAILVTSHQPPNVKNADTNAPATAAMSGMAPGGRSTNGVKCDHEPDELASAPSVNAKTSAIFRTDTVVSSRTPSFTPRMCTRANAAMAATATSRAPTFPSGIT